MVSLRFCPTSPQWKADVDRRLQELWRRLLEEVPGTAWSNLSNPTNISEQCFGMLVWWSSLHTFRLFFFLPMARFCYIPSYGRVGTWWLTAGFNGSTWVHLLYGMVLCRSFQVCEPIGISFPTPICLDVCVYAFIILYITVQMHIAMSVRTRGCPKIGKLGKWQWHISWSFKYDVIIPFPGNQSLTHALTVYCL